MLSARKAIRAGLERAGYRLTHRDVLPLGVDPVWDIQRLAERLGLSVDCVFDVGAHIGETALRYLAAFPQARVHAFEPHPNSFACLAQLSSPRLSRHPVAVSDRCGEAPFFVYGEVRDPTLAQAGSMNSSLVQDTQFSRIGGRYTKSITVETVTVDTMCARLGAPRVDLLKIDTEGHEAEVLDGAAETLRRGAVGFVFLEFETVLPVAGAVGGALAPAAERLEPLGYRLMATYPNHMLADERYASFNALYVAPGGRA